MKKSKDGEDGLLSLRAHQQQKLASSLPHITELRPFKNPAFYLSHRHVSSCATTEGSDGCARGKKDNSRVRRMYERKKKKQSFSVLQGYEDQEGEAVPPRRSTSRGQHSQANGAAWGCSARAAPRGFGISCQQQPSSGTRSQQVQVVPFFSPTVCCRNSRNGA